MATRLQESFAAVYRLLERPRAARWVLGMLLITHTFLLGYSGYVHSPTFNEPAHLVAGLSHWKFGRFELYRVNPPLVRMVAALPVIALGYTEDWSEFHDAAGYRAEFVLGKDFITSNRERSIVLIMIARWVCIPFSWIGAITCYLWARDLYGRPSGVLACAIWCFEPNIVAHASLITPDAHATALGVAACYTFWRWLKQPTWMFALLSGVALGIASLTKSTLVVLYLTWPAVWVIRRCWWQRASNWRDWLRDASMIFVCMTTALYVLNFGYGFEGSLKPLKEYHFVSDRFSGRVSASSGAIRELERKHINRFNESWVGFLRIPLPENYLTGIDVQQRDFESYGRSYLNERWSKEGWWYYYIYACAIKIPVAIWSLAFLVVGVRILEYVRWRNLQLCIRKDQAGVVVCDQCSRLRGGLFQDEFVLLFPASVVSLIVSSNTGFSEHMRYVLPAFPFCFVAVSQIASLLTALPGHASLSLPRGLLMSSIEGWSSTLTGEDAGNYNWSLLEQGRSHSVTLLLAMMTSVLICWFVSSVVWLYPHSLSYFNEFVGGPLNGPYHLLGSNVDWGQDLKYAKSWLDEHPIDSKCVDCQSLFELDDIGIRGCHNWGNEFSLKSHLFPEVDSDVRQFNALIVSLNTLFFQFSTAGQLDLPFHLHQIDWKNYKVIRIGYSMIALERSDNPVARDRASHF